METVLKYRMDSIYENTTFIPSPVALNENISQPKGNSSNKQESEREVNSAKRTKVLLIVLSLSLVFAVGGLCVLGTLYSRASMQLSAQETNSMLMVKELTANNNRVKDDLRNKDTMVKELTANYNRVKEQLSVHEAFRPSNCDVNMIDYQGKRYFFSCDKLTWSCSRAFCALRGTDLVTITSQSEQTFLHFKIKEWYWIGLNDQEEEGRWVWVNNQTLNDTGVEFWHERPSKSEPDNWKEDDPSGENCAIVRKDFIDSNSWFDVSCKHTYKFICEKKI